MLLFIVLWFYSRLPVLQILSVNDLVSLVICVFWLLIDSCQSLFVDLFYSVFWGVCVFSSVAVLISSISLLTATWWTCPKKTSWTLPPAGHSVFLLISPLFSPLCLSEPSSVSSSVVFSACHSHLLPVWSQFSCLQYLIIQAFTFSLPLLPSLP